MPLRPPWYTTTETSTVNFLHTRTMALQPVHHSRRCVPEHLLKCPHQDRTTRPASPRSSDHTTSLSPTTAVPSHPGFRFAQPVIRNQLTRC